MNPNNKLTHLPFVIIPLFLFLLSCDGIDRYEEGPFLSLKTAEERAMNNWRWAYYEENGTNLSGIYADSSLSIEKNNVAKIIGSDDGFREGSWHLISKNRQLQLIFDGQAYAYTIEMLKENEMWLFLNDTINDFSRDWQLKEK